MPMSDHPILIYLSLIVSALLLLSQAVPKVLGPLGKGLTDWARSRRERRIESHQADLIDIQRQVEWLTEQRKADREEYRKEKEEDAAELEKVKEEFAEYRRRWTEREARWRGEWHRHRQWDYKAQEALVGRKPPFDISPPFMTPDPDPSMEI